MNALLEIVASNALLATLMAVAVAMVTRFVRRPEVAYWLWALVLIKLVTPPVFQVPVTLPATAEAEALGRASSPLTDVLPTPTVREDAPEISEEMMQALLADITSALPAETAASDTQPAGPPVVASVKGPQRPVESVREPLPWREWLTGVWVLGSLLWFAIAALRVFRFGRLLCQTEPAPEYLQSAARRVSERYGLKRCPGVRVAAARIPPLLWGSIRGATIVLPSDLMCQLTEAEQTTLLAHDLAHYRRGDHLVRWVEALILGLFWWHPVVWWARSQMRQAEESCCDAWVLWAYPEDAKRYAHTLLTAVEFLSGIRWPLPAVASGMGHFGSLRRRLEMIVHQTLRRQMSWPGFVAVVLVAMLVLPWSAGSVPAEVSESVTSADSEPAVSLGDTCRVSGTVVGSDGNLLEGARVYVVSHGCAFHPVFGHTLTYSALPRDLRPTAFQMRQLEETTTDAAGRFVLDNVPLALTTDWNADIVVWADGMALSLLDWKGTDDVKIEVAKGVTIEGRLLAPDGSPASGVLVEPTTISTSTYMSLGDAPVKDPPAFWPRSVRTDRDGRFIIPNVPEGSQIGFRLRDPRYGEDYLLIDTKLDPSKGPTEAKHTPKSLWKPTPFTHDLTPPRPVRGVVTAADTGEPLANAFVEVSVHGSGVGWSEYGRTDEQGRYKIDVWEAEEYSVLVYPADDSGYLAAARQHEGWPESAKALQLDFVLHRGKLVRGQVVDDQTSQPIAGASVAYRPASGNPNRRDDNAFGNPTLTDEEGRFALTAVAGSGRLTVETPHRIYQRTPFGDCSTVAGLTPVDIPLEGRLDDVVIRMKRGQTVALRVRGPDGEKVPWVRAMWDGTDAAHELNYSNSSYYVPLNVGKDEIDVVISGLDPECSTSVYLINTDLKLGAVFPITRDTPSGPVEVRLQPTATVTGQVVTPEGKPDPKGRVELKIRQSRGIEKPAWEYQSDQYTSYRGFSRHGYEEPPYPDGKFTLDCIVPGLPMGLEILRAVEGGFRPLTTIHLDPFEPSQLRDVGKLVVKEKRKRELKAELPAQPFQEAVFEGGELKIIQAVPVLFLQGEPEEMGRQYGKLALGPVRNAIGLPRRLLGILGENGAWSRLVQLGRTVCDDLPPRDRREFDAALETFQGTDDEVDTVMVANVVARVDFPNSALLVEPARSTTRTPMVGYNLHLETYGVLDRMSLVTVRRPRDGHACVTVGLAGLFGATSGMNETGLTVTVLCAEGARDKSPKYDPQGQFVHVTCARLLEECSTVEEAEKLVRSVNHAARMSLAVCDNRRAVVFEVTPKSVVTRGPENDLLAVTNKFRSPELALSGDCDRYETLERAAQQQKSLAWSDVAQLIDKVGGDSLQMMVFEPGSLKLHVAIGDPATVAGMVTLDLKELFKYGLESR